MIILNYTRQQVGVTILSKASKHNKINNCTIYQLVPNMTRAGDTLICAIRLPYADLLTPTKYIDSRFLFFFVVVVIHKVDEIISNL